MFAPEGPTVRELACQALSSVERGYDLLAPKFDLTPFRTPDAVLHAVARLLRRLGPVERGLDLCCGTGAGMGVLAQVCRRGVTGVDISAGMLAQGRAAGPPTLPPMRGPEAGGRAVPAASGPEPAATQPPAQVDWVRADALALPFGPVFDLVVSFGAFGHFLPSTYPMLFSQVRRVMRPGARFVFPMPAPAGPGRWGYWASLGFDTAMRVRNALWHPPFVMYYRTFPPSQVCHDLRRTGFEVRLLALPELGLRADGGPRCGAIVATRPAG